MHYPQRIRADNCWPAEPSVETPTFVVYLGVFVSRSNFEIMINCVMKFKRRHCRQFKGGPELTGENHLPFWYLRRGAD